MDNEFYGRALREAREKADKYQKDLADAVGMRASRLSALETQGQGLEPDLFIKLCDALEADPLEVADRGYCWFRQHLGEKVAESREDVLRQGPAGGSARPSVDEVMRQYDSVTASVRSLLLMLLGYFRPEKAASTFLADRFRDLDREPEPPKGKGKR